MAERQKHGFVYEEEIIKKNNLIKGSIYTGQWDAQEKNIPVQIITLGCPDPANCSIKSVKTKGEIGFADYLRNFNINENFIIYIGIYKESLDKEKIYYKHYKILVYKDKWKSYFDKNWPIYKILEEFKNVPPDHSYDDEWKKIRKRWKIMYGSGFLVGPRFKRDSKGQRRIQCAMSRRNFNNIFQKENYLIWERDTL